MTHQPPEHRSTHYLEPFGLAHSRSNWLGIAAAVKLIAVAAVFGLLWLLQLRFEIGALALILLHVALVGALLVLGVRSHILRRRRQQGREP